MRLLAHGATRPTPLDQHARPRQPSPYLQGVQELRLGQRRTVVATNQFFRSRTMGCDDTGQPQARVQCRVIAFDDFGNRGSTADATVTIAADTHSTTYADAIRSDHPHHYYRLNEPTGSRRAVDLVGSDDMKAFAGVTRGVSGALGKESDTAVSLSGTPSGTCTGRA